MNAAWEARRPDTYGFIDNEKGDRARRHPKCSCTIPCQRRFVCECPSHRGPKSTPYCNGAADDFLEWCDVCVMRETETATNEEKNR